MSPAVDPAYAGSAGVERPYGAARVHAPGDQTPAQSARDRAMAERPGLADAALRIQLLGRLAVWRQGVPVPEGGWAAGSGPDALPRRPARRRSVCRVGAR